MSRSIFTYSILLGMGGALATALAIAMMILFTSVPIQLPISTLEVSRLLANQPISGANLVPRTVELRTAPGFADGLTPVEQTMKRVLAHSLRVDAQQLRFAMATDALLPSTGINGTYARNIVESERLFGSDPRFGAMIIGPFDAALRLPDGRWRVVSTAGHGPGPLWQIGILKLIALAVIGIVPLAWLVSRVLARPIHAFALSADRVGRGVYKEVPVAGPTEIRQAAAAINDMQRRIEALIRERTAVVGAIAHDLRTPLARMRFLAARIGDADRARFDAEIAGMEHMISVTMDFVQSQTQLPDFSKVDLCAVLQIAAQDLRDLGHDVRMDEAMPAIVVPGDTVLLGRLFANLLGNAIKYGKRAEVRLVEADGHAVVTIADDGPGLTKTGLERAFEPFFREETSRNRTTGGTGLGLAIVQTLVKAHHGSITLANGTQGGLEAIVRIPLSS